MGQLLCGAAKANIVPDERLIGHLAALGNRRIAGVIDEIYLRVIAVSDGERTALLIACDLDKVPCPMENIAAVTAATGIPEEFIFQVSIHTHTAPIAGYRPDEGPNFIERKSADVREATAEYEQFLRGKMVEAAREAVAGMVPAKMGYASGESFLNVNRNLDYTVRRPDGTEYVVTDLGFNPLAEVDRTLFVLEFRDLEDRLLAVFVNYAMHNCCMIGHDYRDGMIGISADIGGNAAKAVEEANPGCVAMWTSGAAGDVNPYICNELTYPDPVTGEPRRAEAEGCAFASMLLRILAARHAEDIRRTMRGVRCDVQSAAVRAGVRWSETPGADGTPYRVRIHGVTIGGLALVGYSGELLTSMGLKLKAESPVKDTVIINHDASLAARSGYIFDDDILERDRECRLPGHRASNITPGCVEASLVRNTRELLEGLHLRTTKM